MVFSRLISEQPPLSLSLSPSRHTHRERKKNSLPLPPRILLPLYGDERERPWNQLQTASLILLQYLFRFLCLFRSMTCRLICKNYVSCSYESLVLSTDQETIFLHNDICSNNVLTPHDVFGGTTRSDLSNLQLWKLIGAFILIWGPFNRLGTCCLLLLASNFISFDTARKII